MRIKTMIPNLFTFLNMLAGCGAVVMLSDLKYDLAFYLVCLGIFFDFFDGFFARKFNVSGPLGVQLDSLADMITSGFVPGYVVFLMLKTHNNVGLESYLPYFGFVITLAACYRLAKFNIDVRQTDSFIGLPTPANALFFTSLPLLEHTSQLSALSEILNSSWVLVALVLLSAYIMNAEIPLFSLKIKDFTFTKYKVQVFFVSVSVLLLVFLQIAAIPLIIISYVLLSIVNNKLINKAL